MNVIVFGASGGVGRHAVRRALDEGHDVTAFVRDPARLDLEHERLSTVVGDVLDAASVERAMAGQDAALVTIGVRRKTDDESMVSQGVANIVAAMEAAGARRLVFLSIMGVGDSRQNLGVARHIVPRMLAKPLAHRVLAEDVITRGNIDWVIVRAVRLADKRATGSYRIGEEVRVGPMANVSRADVGEFMVAALTDATYLGRTPSIAA
jgi:putative NADH-flavin reductase